MVIYRKDVKAPTSIVFIFPDVMLKTVDWQQHRQNHQLGFVKHTAISIDTQYLAESIKYIMPVLPNIPNGSLISSFLSNRVRVGAFFICFLQPSNCIHVFSPSGPIGSSACLPWTINPLITSNLIQCFPTSPSHPKRSNSQRLHRSQEQEYQQHNDDKNAEQRRESASVSLVEGVVDGGWRHR